MNRPLINSTDDELLAESRKLNDLLERATTSINLVSTQLEMFNSMARAKLDADVRDLIGFPNFHSVCAGLFAESRSRIEERLQDIDYELEERELEREQAQDGSDGVAA